jgi:hypothetical protein
MDMIVLLSLKSVTDIVACCIPKVSNYYFTPRMNCFGVSLLSTYPNDVN